MMSSVIANCPDLAPQYTEQVYASYVMPRRDVDRKTVGDGILGVSIYFGRILCILSFYNRNGLIWGGFESGKPRTLIRSCTSAFLAFVSENERQHKWQSFVVGLLPKDPVTWDLT